MNDPTPGDMPADRAGGAPQSGARRGDWLPWLIVGLPWLLLLTFLVHPALRARLLRVPTSVGGARHSWLPPQPATLLDHGTPVPVANASERPPGAGTRAPSTTLATATSAGDGFAASTPAPPAFTPAAASPDEELLQGSKISDFLEGSYRSQLPSYVGPITATATGDQLQMESTVDLERLRSELAAALPDLLEPLLRGEAAVRVDGEIVESRDGVARLRIRGVRLKSIPLPTGLLASFIRAEMEGRGYIVEDPLVRPFHLPAGIVEIGVDEDRLRVRRAVR